ncbi:AfsR/SARP family transcriptional regulator [Catenuloplanes indicus]|uniref:DNA-binding SARP family transcriptional activator n=1 Tax=Catenuloplanes indicus TaxID=137267 RepID=A0AAE3W0T4_9ACTN|nr:BTAD domain-containing putative transcriptional regulator [Catenuloplanes indicus]MDQ0367256.1 DNA-binding SARP family transcriptional activator [Catenuloplanes indicus]
MKYAVLGPLLVSASGREVAIGGPRSQRILAMLLLHAEQVVSVDQLAEAGWDDRLPKTVRRQVQNRVAALRTCLTRVGGVIETHPGGYRLRLTGDELDLRVFDRLVVQAQEETDPSRAAPALRAALALWRGPALAGLTGYVVETLAGGLNERRLTAYLACVDAELAGGGHARLVPELRELVRRHPLRERFAGQLMQALARSGRRTEALETYRDLRDRLVGELGVEPSEPVRAVHRAVLSGDAEMTGPVAALPVPRQLPADVPALVGRADELAKVREALTAGAGTPLVVIEGVGGVGKSALGIRAAHRSAEAFPDGQLYVDLQGSSDVLPALSPLDVLGRFLRAIGVRHDAIPVQLAEAAALFRSELARRRLLVVLDNARDATQVLPLLPGAPGCAVLITARRTVANLPGAYHLRLDVLTAAAAAEQLALQARPARIDADPAAVAEVARWCGYLPLALRVAGARLAARPHWTVRDLADRLADAHRRLDELELPDLGVRTSFAASHRELATGGDRDRAAADAFVALSLLDGPDVPVILAAWLIDRPVRKTEQLVERLVDESLVETSAPGRYRLHDLLRLYGRELAASYPPDRIADAVVRAVRGCTATAWTAVELIAPGDRLLVHAGTRADGGVRFAGTRAALDWLESERHNLTALVVQAAATPGVPGVLAAHLAQALYPFFRLRGHWGDAAAANRVAVAVAERAGDRDALAEARVSLGAALRHLNRPAEAEAELRAALAAHRESGNDAGRAHALQVLGLLRHDLGDRDRAEECYRESLLLYDRAGNIRGQATVLDNLGTVHRDLGRHRQARDCHDRALRIFEQLGDQYGMSTTRLLLGILLRESGSSGAALVHMDACLAGYRRLSDRHGEMEALHHRALLHRDEGRFSAAMRDHEAALSACRDLQRRDAEARELREMSRTLATRGYAERADATRRRAAALAGTGPAIADMVRDVARPGE